MSGKSKNGNTNSANRRFSVKQSKAEDLITRISYGDYTAFNNILPNPNDVLFKNGINVDRLRLLETDPSLTAVIKQRKSATLAMDWKVERSKSPAKVEKLVISVFESLKMRRIISEILDCLKYGYQPMEIVWEVRNDGMTVPKKFLGKPPEWFRYNQENEPVFYPVGNLEGVPLEFGHFLIARNEPTYQNPYGDSLLASCFWPITFKRSGWRFMVDASERFSSAFMVGKYDENRGDESGTELLEQLENLAESYIGSFPSSTEVEIKEAPKNNGQLHESLINICNSEIAKCWVGQTLTADSGTNGSRSLGEVHNDVRLELAQNDQYIVEDILNNLIRLIVDVNFGQSTAQPYFTFYSESGTFKEFSERDLNLTSMGVKFKKEYISNQYNIPEEQIEMGDPTIEDDFSGVSSFAERAIPKEQQAIDQLASILDKSTRKYEKPIEVAIKSIESAKDFSEAIENLEKSFEDLRNEELEDAIFKATAIARTFGQDVNES